MMFTMIHTFAFICNMCLIKYLWHCNIALVLFGLIQELNILRIIPDNLTKGHDNLRAMEFPNHTQA